MLWELSRIYAHACSLVKKTTGVHLKGVGFLLRRLRSDHQLSACGYQWFVDHRIAATYASLLRGSYNEPETHAFLLRIADSATQSFTFVDVGANIGEMMVPMSAHPKCAVAIAFEPNPVVADVLRRNLVLNGLRGAVFDTLVGDGTEQPYVVNERSSPESGIQRGATGVPLTRTVRLDDTLNVAGDCVLLIDVEGAELQVMQGAADFIRTNRPLIIFEYHHATRKVFSLDDVRAVIGEDYEILRLRNDGFVDETLTNTWNCVAVHPGSVFYNSVANMRR